MHDDAVVIDGGNAAGSPAGSVQTGQPRQAGQAGQAAESASRPSSAPHDPALARFYMTSDLRAATSLTRTHLDFYLREGVIVPTARTESGYLLFDDGELGTLRQVIAWRQDGVGIREIRARLNRSRPGEDV
ncbi:MAG: MerR family transcriptional regulator, partial [Chloroflexia bacterium]|nr:MerR family transcriptional regulator [Chloroflexia bacterium]